MPAPAPSWNTCRVYGTWNKMDGSLRPGTYKVTLPFRVTNATDDVIIPAGVFATGELNTTPGVPSLDVDVPSNSDPDNSPNGWQPVIEVTFPDAAGEKYLIDTPVDGEVNLRTVVLAASIPVPQTVLIRGVPGGLAELDADGDVIDAEGAKVGGLTEVADASITAAKLAPGVLPTTLPPTDASVTTAKLVDGAVTAAKSTGLVPTTRTIAGKPLSADVTLTASDVSAVPTTRTVAGKALSANVTLAVADITGAAPTASPTFTGTVTVPDASFTTAKVSGLDAALTARGPKTEAMGVRVKSGGTWPARPSGYAVVLSVGADPSPVDQVAGDLRWIPAS